ncbi:MAG: hypothetical protein K2N07_07665, partial [Desulfovibrio sp.]|nr:hypothetical protein [Desulfovibrio sp.]
EDRGGAGEAARALTQARLEDAVRRLAESADGRFFLRWLIHGAGVFRAVYPQSHAEAAFQEGRRTVGLSVMQLCVNVGAGDILLDNEMNNEMNGEVNHG